MDIKKFRKHAHSLLWKKKNYKREATEMQKKDDTQKQKENERLGYKTWKWFTQGDAHRCVGNSNRCTHTATEQQKYKRFIETFFPRLEQKRISRDEVKLNELILCVCEREISPSAKRMSIECKVGANPFSR